MDNTEKIAEKIEWVAPEYEERERDSQWFWALGIIVVAVSATSIIYGNYFFAALIILGGGMLGFFALRKPDMISYELSEKGVRMGTRLFPYENISHFWVETRGRDLLFIRTERFFMPVLSMPIPSENSEYIRAIFLDQNIPEEEMQIHTSERIMDALGF